MMKSNKDYVEVVYNTKDRPYTSYPNKLIKHLIKKFSLKPHSKVLEIGCGRGEFIKSFMDQGFDAYGFDLSDFASSVLPKNKFESGDFLISEAYEENSFDIIFTKSFIEHFYFPEKIFQKINKLLKEGGILITMTPEWKYNFLDFYEDFTHRTPFSKESLRDIHLIYGYSNIQITSFKQLPILWNSNQVLNFISYLTRVLMPDFLKKKYKFIKFSKEIMLLSYAKKN